MNVALLNVALAIIIESCSHKICTKASKIPKHKYKQKCIITAEKQMHLTKTAKMDDTNK